MRCSRPPRGAPAHGKRPCRRTPNRHDELPPMHLLLAPVNPPQFQVYAVQHNLNLSERRLTWRWSSTKPCVSSLARNEGLETQRDVSNPSCRYGQGRGDEPGISTAGSRGSGCPALAGPATAARTDSTSMADSNDLMITLQCCCRGFLSPEPSRSGLGPAEQVSITQA